MDSTKVETNGLVSGHHSDTDMSVPSLPDSKPVENKTPNKVLDKTLSTSTASDVPTPQPSTPLTACDTLSVQPSIVIDLPTTESTLKPVVNEVPLIECSTQPTTSDVLTIEASKQSPVSDVLTSQPTQPIVPTVLTQKSTKNEKTAENANEIVGKKTIQSKEEVRRVTRHSPQNSNHKSNTSPSVKALTANSTICRTTASALLSPLSSPNKYSKQLPVVAHKRSPSSPVPNHFLNASLVRATKSQPTPVLKANFIAAQKAKAANSLPKVDTKRPKRKLESKKVSTKPVGSPQPEENGEPSASKRVRLQYQPFQSPEPLPPMPLIYRALTVKKEEEEKLMIYRSNEFLAVRNESNGFYICRAKQNVFRNSRKFKIQWFNNDSNPRVYKPDFSDVTDFECILSNITLDRLDKGQYGLPTEEEQRVMNILQRTLNVEKGINEIPDPNKVTADGVDISIVGTVDEKELMKKISPKRSKQTVSKPKPQSMATSPESIGSPNSPKVSTRLKKRIVITHNGPSSTATTSSAAKVMTTRTTIVTTNKLPKRRSTRSTGSITPNVSSLSSDSSPKDKKPGIEDLVNKLKTRNRFDVKEVTEQKKSSLNETKKISKTAVPAKNVKQKEVEVKPKSDKDLIVYLMQETVKSYKTLMNALNHLIESNAEEQNDSD